MHPAYSVILFTTASGAGYGLLICLALLGAAGLVPPTWPIGLVGLGLALGLISVGLLSSTFHLGRPERAWRAMSQWRSSWLSREGLAALATFVPAGLLALGWVLEQRFTQGMTVAALAAAGLAALTVGCTGMIYASLPTIRQWHQPLVTPVYLALALASGALLAHPLLLAFATAPEWWGWITVALVAIAAVLKLAYWRAIDRAAPVHTVEAATGLGRFGSVRPVVPAHTRANFVMREMGYSVARKHAMQLRRIAVAMAFVAPGVLTLLAMPAQGALALAIAVAAVLAAAVGLVVERWLFFAEAQHVVTLYYGEARA